MNLLASNIPTTLKVVEPRPTKRCATADDYSRGAIPKTPPRGTTTANEQMTDDEKPQHSKLVRRKSVETSV